MESGIYKIENTKTGKCYVGSAKNFKSRWARHFKDLENGCHSSIKLQRSYNKHGRDVFITCILEELPYSKDIIIDRENYWMQKLNSKENGYNIADAAFGDTITHHPNRDEIIKKRTNTIKNNCSKMTAKERSLKFGHFGADNGMFGKTHTPETRKKLSELALGNSYAVGHKVSDEGREKLSKLAKERTGEKNPFFGKTHSEETRKKLSKALRGNIPPNTMKYSINGIVYTGLREAEEHTNIKRSTIRHRCLSSKFPTYFMLPLSS
ncbi:homing endonuclease [Acinetobacter phage vB_AbaM_Kimel]|uniref:Putative I-TevI-like homing endonuclease n=4 Tax=Lazarusvirus TaxID=2842820 RepID=A0A6B9LPS8_9CAUD|nr:homing endonuclease [Acinetobacter phage vB_AbaM_Apostate]YP_009886747.1 homing endonuclease [Acinetobacter phage vB_AbaM_Kimel]QKE55923.1 putative intron endonuclease [Acinetobacter phage Octan]QNO11343.1 putative intron endonuclease [Acinetobacter phage Meroveus]QGZ15810.1 putative intron endonuclease [Acinetobacter phage vB_AbaM_Apostate]QHB48381.1 putative I-TevI-like homing endonuclease [Acinetobacter phage vB_AbaM_Kimel]